jgi:hypothetical protein
MKMTKLSNLPKRHSFQKKEYKRHFILSVYSIFNQKFSKIDL